MSEIVASEYRVEYLCTLNSDGNFCNSVMGFKSLLESYEKLKIIDDKIIWEDSEFNLVVNDGTVLNSNFKFFHLKITNSNNENKSDFLALLKVIRTILSKVNNNQPPEILWDDISSEYAIKSYPIIHELENLMRKLITKFMITKVGLSWTKDNIPKEVAESIKNGNSSKKQNYIYDTDFIQLSNFLFKEYSIANSDEFVEKIKKANNVSDLNLDELKKIVPLSNWTRYFNPIVECSSEELRGKWGKLYDLRCKVAHNNFMDEDDFKILLSNSEIVKKFILDAINNLDQVKIDEDEKEELAENAAINLNRYYGDFVVKWKEVESVLNSINPNKSNSTLNNIQYLFEKGFITQDELKNFNELKGIRNLIVHDSNFELNEMQFATSIKDLNWWHNKLINLANQTANMNGWFEISQSHNGEFRFVLKSFNGEILLTSQLFKDKKAASKTIELLKTQIKDRGNYVSKVAINGKSYFNILANNKILATSQFYSNSILRNIGIFLVHNTTADEIIDSTKND